MTHENKCFFSISLENGITITGNSPKEVSDYLADLRIAVVQAQNDELKNDKDHFWIDRYEEMKNELLDAICTICNNMKGEEQ